MELPEREETNELLCVIVRKNGAVECLPNGKIKQGDKLPMKNDWYSVGGMGCQVAGHAYTPNLGFTWHLFLTEIGP
ncbi:hypothetical protein [Tardiphaga robiniae]|uniref:Uncharacterized protein n=1 Tax=Tardiphaga robiniae TaxID=943830 RepID=A0A163X5P6_9BRAD|nr:hypothetical protein [Tardiphaga robiniae]KZD20448.1 hypothetical protein A4A58_19690 [Tardiphaga robiniae]